MSEKPVPVSSVCFRRSRLEINVQLISMAGSLVLAGICLGLTGPFRWPWGLAAGIFALVMALFFLYQAGSAMEKLWWEPQEHRLRQVRFGKTTLVPLGELERIRSYPAWGRTVLRWGKKRFYLHHQLLGADVILKNLQGLRPDLFPDPQETLKLRTSVLSLLILTVFTLGVLSSGLLLGIYQKYFVVLGVVFALAPLVRMLLFTPVMFYLSPGGIRVRFLVRSRFYRREKLRKIVEDTYAASGCSYYLMKFLFQDGTVILDEGSLMSPLKSRSRWIYDVLQLDERS